MAAIPPLADLACHVVAASEDGSRRAEKLDKKGNKTKNELSKITWLPIFLLHMGSSFSLLWRGGGIILLADARSASA